MTAQGFCGKCGAALAPGSVFCGRCGSAVAQTAAPLAQQVASAQLSLEAMRWRLIPLRLLGLGIGLALWWLVVGPAGNVLVTMVSLPVLALGGLYLGNIAGLAMLRG